MAKRTVPKKAVQHCPFCDAELIAANLPVCQACQVTILYCPECQKPLPKGKKTCPSCGATVKR